MIKKLLTTLFLLICLNCYADDSIIYRYNNTWYMSNQLAYSNARLENKNVLFVFGAEWCGLTQGSMRAMGNPPLYSILNEKYVFRYDTTRTHWTNGSTWWALKHYDHLVDLNFNPMSIPIFCIVSPDNMNFPISRKQSKSSSDQGIYNSDTLYHFLVSNLFIYNDTKIKCYYDNGILIIESLTENELIFVYSISGKLLSILHKKSDTFHKTIHLSSGVYIITGHNWTKKLWVK